MSDIVVPASISNLGPGFDTLGVALQLYLRVRVIDLRPGSGGDLACEFLDQPPLGENRIAEAFQRASDRFGPPPNGLRVEVRSEIPQRAGLGSSAAATIAGFELYGRAGGVVDRAEWLALATSIEGHPDNAAAALHGGFTCCCQYGDGRVVSGGWPWPSSIAFVVATPAQGLETSRARQVLPAAVPLADAIFNLQHATLLVHAVQAGRFERLREAMRDRWHHAVRMPLVPGLREALDLDHPALLGVCLAGSGPTIAALTESPAEVVPLLRTLYDRLGVPCTIRSLSAHQPDMTRADLVEAR